MKASSLILVSIKLENLKPYIIVFISLDKNFPISKQTVINQHYFFENSNTTPKEQKTEVEKQEKSILENIDHAFRQCNYQERQSTLIQTILLNELW